MTQLRERLHDLSLGERHVEPREDDLRPCEVAQSVDIEASVVARPERGEGGDPAENRAAAPDLNEDVDTHGSKRSDSGGEPEEDTGPGVDRSPTEPTSQCARM